MAYPDNQVDQPFLSFDEGFLAELDFTDVDLDEFASNLWMDHAHDQEIVTQQSEDTTTLQQVNFLGPASTDSRLSGEAEAQFTLPSSNTPVQQLPALDLSRLVFF